MRNSILVALVVVIFSMGMFAAMSVTLSPTSNQIYYRGYTITFNAAVTGGAPPYTYEYEIFNYPNNAQLVDTTLFSNSFTWSIPNGLFGNTVYANVLVSDSGTNVVSSPNTGLLFLFTPQPIFIPNNDVLVIHQAGTYSVYQATSSSQTANGLALTNAISSLTSGDSVYLRAETYNIISNSLIVPSNINVFGSGAQKTVIKGQKTANAIVSLSSNEILADVKIIGNIQNIIGMNVTPAAQNDVLRNVYIQLPASGTASTSGYGFTPNLGIGGTSTSNNIYIYNMTITSGTKNNDGVYWSSQNALRIFDSNINLQFSGGLGGTDIGLLSIGNVISVNSVVSAISGSAYGYEGAGNSNTFIYGGSASSSCSIFCYDLNNVGSGLLGVNSTVAYSTTSGVITNLGSAPYGVYSYQKSPLTLPIVLSSNSLTESNTPTVATLSTTWNGIDSPYTVGYTISNSLGICLTQTYTGVSGSFNSLTWALPGICGYGSLAGNIVISDSAVAFVTNNILFSISLSPSPPASGPAFKIQQGHTAVINNQGATAGATPYTYQWFEAPPPCSSYSPIPNGGAPEFYSNRTTYFFNTNNMTPLGISCFILQAKNGTGITQNAVEVGVNVTAYFSTSNAIGGTNIYLFDQASSLDLGGILVNMAVILLIVRLLLYKQKAPQMFFLTGLSMILMMFAAYFLSFPFINTMNATANTGNMLTTINSTSSIHPAYASFEVPTLFLMTLIWEIVCALVLFGDAASMGLTLFKK